MAHPASRRTALVGVLAAALAGMGVGRARRPGMAQDADTPVATPVASPLASPVASPGPLDLLAGTPVTGTEALGRGGRICRPRYEECRSFQDAVPGSSDLPLSYPTDQCCSQTCRFWLLPSGETFGRLVPPGWYCD